MFMDVTGISSLNEQPSKAAIEEDYCRFAARRFQAQWEQNRVFSPAALRYYGVRGEATLAGALQQVQTFGASFGMFCLGEYPSEFLPPGLAGTTISTISHDGTTEVLLPFNALIQGAYHSAKGNVQTTAAATTTPLTPQQQEQVMRTWRLLQAPQQWSQSMCGVVTPLRWDSAYSRSCIKQQLQLASFLGVKAVHVTLPLLAEVGGGGGGEDSVVSASDSDLWHGDDMDIEDIVVRGEAAAAASPLRAANTAMLCEAAEVLREFIESSPSAKVWVRCDAHQEAHRRQLRRLQQALLYGYDKVMVYPQDSERGPANMAAAVNTDVDEASSIGSNGDAACVRYIIRSASAGQAQNMMRRETIGVLLPLLYFSGGDSGGGGTSNGGWDSVSTEWLGEDVVAFEVPAATVLAQLLAPRDFCGSDAAATAVQSGGGTAVRTAEPVVISGLSSPCSLGREFRAELPSRDDSGKGDPQVELYDAETAEELRRQLWGEDHHHHHHSTSTATPPCCDERDSNNNAIGQQQEQPHQQCRRRYVYSLPEDLMPSNAARWSTCYPPRVSFVTFLVELLRRRAAPIFSGFFFDHYALINYLYFAAAVDAPRDIFAGFEDVLQLPLQPLGHQLASGIYEVFERDASKYAQYREAVFRYARDWAVDMGVETHHQHINADYIAEHDVPTGSTEGECLYIVLLGCGRGPLIDECLSAASTLGVRVRLFAIEKNPPAAAFTKLRWMCDAEWRHLAETFGHSVEVIVADGRHVFDERHSLHLPWDFGLCDVVVSELLGSFGDNELSPECLEGFHNQLRCLQAEKGIRDNPYLISIPQSYTAYVAPMHSARFEQAVAEASVRGLTVRPTHCADRHTALYHSVFVCNLSRGMLLAPPQPCWTFTHFTAAAPNGAGWCGGNCSNNNNHNTAGSASATPMSASGSTFRRKAAIFFEIPPQGRCSAFAGFFSSVLYRSPFKADEAAVMVSTEATHRTTDMYSWFPCIFPLDPAASRELRPNPADSNSKSATVSVVLYIQRRSNKEEGRVWYRWGVQYPPPRDNIAAASATPMTLMNEEGWASSMYL